jgi:hypothetical protein
MELKKDHSNQTGSAGFFFFGFLGTDDTKKQEMVDLFIANQIITEKPVFPIQIELCASYVTRSR